VSRPLSPAEAAKQGPVIYRTGWPRRWGLVRMLAMVAFPAAYVSIVWLAPTAVLGKWDPPLKWRPA
jgi:hypothetical protein